MNKRILKITVTLLILLKTIEGKWNATGRFRQLWSTPVMEYEGLFSATEIAKFSDDVKIRYSEFLEHRNDPTWKKKESKPQKRAFGFSTPNDKDTINDQFFSYQTKNPINSATLDAIWQAFVFACHKFVEESGMPPIEYQRETVMGGELEWTSGGVPRRGSKYCWGSLQSGGMHHDVHLHPGAALAGTIYLSVPPDGGALSLTDPRGPMPPFNVPVRMLPKEGKWIIFPGTLPHGVHSTPGDMPRVSISCNHPGDWKKFASSANVAVDSTWSHEMMSHQEKVEMMKKKRSEAKNVVK